MLSINSLIDFREPRNEIGFVKCEGRAADVQVLFYMMGIWQKRNKMMNKDV